MRLLSFPRKVEKQHDIVTDRMVLRRPVLNDYEEWAHLRDDSADHLQPFEPRWSRQELSQNAYKARLRQQDADITSGRGQHWFLRDRYTDALMGGIALTNIRRGIVESGTLGYWIGVKYINQHFMREAVCGVTHHAFHTLNLHRVEASTVIENVASQKLLLASGFSKEGQAPAYLKINGEWRDHFLFGRVNPFHLEPK